MILQGRDFIISRKFVKFGRMDSRHYKVKLISGKWPDWQDLIDYCANGSISNYKSHGGGYVRIEKNKTGKVIVYTG